MSERITEAQAVEEYLRELKAQVPPFVEGEEAQLNKAILAGDDTARQRMIEGHLPMVVSIAKRYRGRGIALLDLIEIGNNALIQAAQQYDPLTHRKFSLYADNAVRQAITREIANTVTEHRIPVAYIEKLNRVMKAARQLEVELGREPTAMEVAATMDIPAEEAERLMQVSAPTASAQRDRADIILQASKVSDEEFAAYIEGLPARYGEVMALRCGRVDGRIHSYEEVAEAFGVKPERIRHIESRFLRRFGRLPSRSDAIRKFVEE